MEKKGKHGKSNKQLHKIHYEAATKTIKAIRDDYLAAYQPGRRQSISEGISAHFYDLQKKPASQVHVRRIYELQELLKEIQAGRIKPVTSKPVPNTSIELQSKQKKPAPAVLDKAPDQVKRSRSFFGNSTQFLSENHQADICDVVIGFDFGTACSKVVLRTPFQHNRAFVIPFGAFGHPSCEYLLPTHISLSNNYYFIPSGKDKASRSDLKMRLIGSLKCDADRSDVVEDAIAYFALVFRFVRSWFIREQSEVYGFQELNWHVNIGIPSATSEDENICHLYNQVAFAAWALSLADGDINLQKILETRDAIHLGKITEDDIPPIEIFPEMAAEVAGYTQSDLRREGLHLLIDVGAGTLDICGFNVIRMENENRLPLFSTSVEPNGVKALHHIRKKAVVDTIGEYFDILMPDAITPLNELSKYKPDQIDSNRMLELADQTFFLECRTQLIRLATHLKRMHPAAQEWKSQFRVFICGGGSTIHLYRNLVTEFSDWLREYYVSQGATLILFPRQEKVHGDISAEDYHRFGVAVGLSHYSADFDRVMKNIKPIIEEQSAESSEPWFLKKEYAYLVDY